MQIVASAPRSSGQSAPISALQAPGSRLHQKYHILEQIGEGGYASIYKACERENQRLFVAIKAINLEGMSADQIIDATATFNTELTILSSLKHPAIPTIYDHFTDASHWYLVMSFIEGQTLEKYFSTLTQDKYRDPQTVCTLFEIALELCNVLMYMHRQQPAVIYRDLKPANIMIGRRNHVTLIDFGIARHFKPGQNKDTIPFGSPGYAAPEQYGKAQTTPRSDIYSLGALLHQMLTGEDPADHPFEFPAIHITTPGLPVELGNFIARMLALDPEQRPTSMLDVQYQLKQAYIGLKDRLSNKVQNSVPVQTLVNRRAVLGWGASGLVGLAVIGLTALLDNHNQPPASIQPTSTQAPTSTPVTYVTPDDTIPRTPDFTKVEVVSTQNVPNQETATVSVNGVDVPFNIVASTNNSVHVIYADHTVSYTGHKKPVKYLSYITGNTNIASCAENDTAVHIWDCATGQLYQLLYAPSPVVALSIEEDSLAIACIDNVVYFYDLTKISDATHPTPQRKYPNDVPVTALTLLHPSNTYYDHIYVGFGCLNGLVQVWQDDKMVTQYEHSKAVTALAFWDQLIASSSADQTVQVYQFTTNASFALYMGHTRNNCKVNTATWLSYDTLASLDESGEVHIWTYPTGKIVLSEPLLTTRADPNYNMSTYITNSQYYLTCLTDPNSLTTYRIS